MSDTDIVRRLDRLIGIMELAYRDDIQRARAAVRADPANATILDATTGDEPTPAAAVTRAVTERTSQSARSAARRIAALVEMGAVEKVGAGAPDRVQGDGADLMASVEELLEEMLRWQRAAVLPEVAENHRVGAHRQDAGRHQEAPDSVPMCGGSTKGTEIASAVGVSNQSISNWTRRWRDLGIAYETDGGQIRHLVSLEALGLPVDIETGR